MAGLTLIATWITTPSFRTRSSQAWSALWGPSAVRSSSPSRSYPHIGLQARTQDRDLEVSWNRESPWITAATSGLISIEDGASKRQITLDSQQLRGERILYSPTSDQVLIQLTITTSGAVATESVRVLLLQSGKAKTTSPEVFQSSSTAVETRARPQSTQLTQALKPFTGPSIPMSNASPAVPLLNGPPQDLIRILLLPVSSLLAYHKHRPRHKCPWVQLCPQLSRRSRRPAYPYRNRHSRQRHIIRRYLQRKLRRDSRQTLRL